MLNSILFAALLLFSPQPPAEDVPKGQAAYRSNCAFCHGLTGLGGRGPNLVSHPKPEDEVKRIVKQGVPGTTMPSFGGFEEDELTALAQFVQHLAGSAPKDQKVTGDAAKGRQVYAKLGCANCHQIGAQGSTYGPELTRIGSARPVHYLEESITTPSNDVPPEYEGVTVATADGRKVQGVRINADPFTVQVRLQNEKLRTFVIGKDAKEVTRNTTSLMPPYKLPKADLDNLAAYLTTLRSDATSGQAKQAEGIK
ncbi:MAG: c-type cytochrome [Bryobacteraceae bacterium]|nr:c-type cytochrome [Bryobacteraceae bacterium]